ncbi:hypothetical protein KC19_6G057000 [Ceratodon purpureus]|uniref:C2H2-type domain-containing protein n=1 Tax=Ceratodon purpureus TaxID=3225 RepID=A0A8T0HEA3_CERPU|nr:hypothetical protein KC19_6G057000 [Ceratodon purpureus]
MEELPPRSNMDDLSAQNSVENFLADNGVADLTISPVYQAGVDLVHPSRGMMRFVYEELSTRDNMELSTRDNMELSTRDNMELSIRDNMDKNSMWTDEEIEVANILLECESLILAREEEKEQRHTLYDAIKTTPRPKKKPCRYKDVEVNPNLPSTSKSFTCERCKSIFPNGQALGGHRKACNRDKNDLLLNSNEVTPSNHSQDDTVLDSKSKIKDISQIR